MKKPSENSKKVEALTMTRGKSSYCSSSKSQTHGTSMSLTKKYLKFYHCGKRRHAKKYYWHRKNGLNNSEASTSQGFVANTLEDVA